MTQQQPRFFEIDACLAKANSARETWPAAPETEKHRVACSNVEVLELERAIVKDALRNAQNEGGTGDGELSRLGVSSDRAKLMSALSIAYDGRRYYHGPFRYDKLESVNYAKRRQARVVGIPREVPTPTPAMCSEPSDAERER